MTPVSFLDEREEPQPRSIIMEVITSSAITKPSPLSQGFPHWPATVARMSANTIHFFFFSWVSRCFLSALTFGLGQEPMSFSECHVLCGCCLPDSLGCQYWSGLCKSRLARGHQESRSSVEKAQLPLDRASLGTTLLISADFPLTRTHLMSSVKCRRPGACDSWLDSDFAAARPSRLGEGRHED